MSEWKAAWQKFKKSGQETLIESTLNRVMSHIEKHDSAILSAFRNEYSKKENYERSRELRAFVIQEYKYQMTKIKGSFIEGFVSSEDRSKLDTMDPESDEYKELASRVEKQVKVSEQSMFVLNSNDDPKFHTRMAELSERYEQDSIMFIPQGGDNIKLYGTREGSTEPPYHEEYNIGSIVLNKEGEFMTQVGGRPFVVESNQMISQNTFSRNQLMCMSARVRDAKKNKT